jgi:hypothetical protein
MSAAHPSSRLEQVQAMPPEAMIPAHVAKDAVEQAISHRLSAAVERELTLQMWAKIGTAHLLVGLPRAYDDDEAGYDERVALDVERHALATEVAS